MIYIVFLFQIIILFYSEYTAKTIVRNQKQIHDKIMYLQYELKKLQDKRQNS